MPQVVPHVYVHQGTQIDVALPPGEKLAYNVIIDDPRWTMKSVIAGDRTHVSFKAGGVMVGPDLALIPTTKRMLHLTLSSGVNESTTYAVYFFDPHPVRQAVSRRSAPKPTAPKPLARSCNEPRLDRNYKAQGDKRIDVAAVCDDGAHTYVQVNLNRNSPSVVLYKVEGGQDQIVNGPPPVKDDQGKRLWFTAAGIGSHWALVTDTAKGHIRSEIMHG